MDFDTQLGLEVYQNSEVRRLGFKDLAAKAHRSAGLSGDFDPTTVRPEYDKFS